MELLQRVSLFDLAPASATLDLPLSMRTGASNMPSVCPFVSPLCVCVCVCACLCLFCVCCMFVDLLQWLPVHMTDLYLCTSMRWSVCILLPENGKYWDCKHSLVGRKRLELRARVLVINISHNAAQCLWDSFSWVFIFHIVKGWASRNRVITNFCHWVDCHTVLPKARATKMATDTFAATLSRNSPMIKCSGSCGHSFHLFSWCPSVEDSS